MASSCSVTQIQARVPQPPGSHRNGALFSWPVTQRGQTDATLIFSHTSYRANSPAFTGQIILGTVKEFCFFRYKVPSEQTNGCLWMQLHSMLNFSSNSHAWHRGECCSEDPPRRLNLTLKARRCLVKQFSAWTALRTADTVS